MIIRSKLKNPLDYQNQNYNLVNNSSVIFIVSGWYSPFFKRSTCIATNYYVEQDSFKNRS
jgi:hypothetical protein